MSRQAIEDAYIAGFNDGRDSVGKVTDDDAAAHCMLGFDGWYAKSLETLDRSPTVADADGWIAWDGSAWHPPGLSDEAMVQVKFRSGRVDKGSADLWYWEHTEIDTVDIIAYRVVKP